MTGTRPRFDGWMDGWIDGRMDIQMDGCMEVILPLFNSISVVSGCKEGHNERLGKIKQKF